MSNISKCTLIQNFNSYLNKKTTSMFNSVIISIVFNVVHFSKSNNKEKIIILSDTNIAVITQEIEEVYYDLLNVNMDIINMTEVASGVLFISSNSLNYKVTELEINANHELYELGKLKVFNMSIYNSVAKNLKVNENTLLRLSYIANKLFVVLVDKLSDTNVEMSLLESRLKMILFSAIVFSIIFNKNKSIKLCYLLNPFYPIEAGMLLAAKLCTLTTWFVPHGLPQKSHFINTYDIVTPLTLRDNSWHHFYAKKFIYLPWSESKYIDRKSSSKNTRKKINLLFFSQLSGAELHGVGSLKEVTKRFIFLVSQNKYVNQVKIRFRNKDEKDEYLGNTGDLSFIQFSIATEHNIQQDLDEADCIVSCSSTAMLYAQACNIPSIHVYDKTIIDIWPYDLSSPERSIEIKNTEEDMELVNCAVDSVVSCRYNKKLLYLENISSNIEKLFDWEA